MEREPYPIDAVSLFMEPVVAQLALHEEQDQQAAGDPDGQARDVDQGESFVFPNVSNGCR